MSKLSLRSVVGTHLRRLLLRGLVPVRVVPPGGRASAAAAAVVLATVAAITVPVAVAAVATI